MVAGFGMVAHNLVERLSALDALGRFDVTLIGEEPHPAYDRVRLTGWLDHRDPRRLALGRAGWSEAPGIRAVTGVRVAVIDRDDRAVRTSEGERIPYDRLVLATGSAPFVPPIEGAGSDGVYVYRTIDDLGRIGSRAADVGTAIVVGGGLLGLEAADALRRLGLGVVVLESGPFLLSRQLDADAGALLEAHVRGTGVRTITGVRARRIEARDGQLLLEADGRGEPLTAGMIVLTAGIRPRDELGRDSGLDVAPERGGIAVDDELRTSDPAIHAIGECASHEGVVYDFVAPGFRMAETLAEILAGRQARFRGHTLAVRLRLPGIEVWSLGDNTQPGVRVRWRGDGSYRRITLWGRRVIAAASVGPWEEIGQAQEIIRDRQLVSPEQLWQFHQTGRFRTALRVPRWASGRPRRWYATAWRSPGGR